MEKHPSTLNVTVHNRMKEYSYYSLELLAVQNRFRWMMIWLLEWVWFDRLIMFLILLNSAFLAWNDYSYRLKDGRTTWRNDLVEQSEIYFLVLFTIECSIKIVGKGFSNGKNTYMRDAWNVLDLVVVLTGWMGFIPGMANFTALRTLRVLRPLRSVKSVKEIKILVRSLLQSVPALGNVVIFLLFIYIVLGIIGVTLLKGALYQRWRYTEEPVNGEWPADPEILQLCALDGFGLFQWPEDRYCGLPGQYQLFGERFDEEIKFEQFDWGIVNFDNLASAFLSIFQIMTLEGWNKMMYNFYDSQNPVILSVYFSMSVLIITFFILNLMLAAIWSTFTKVSEKERQKVYMIEPQVDTDEGDNLGLLWAKSKAITLTKEPDEIHHITHSRHMSHSNPDVHLVPMVSEQDDHKSVVNESFEDIEPNQNHLIATSRTPRVHFQTDDLLMDSIEDLKSSKFNKSRLQVFKLVDSRAFMIFITICIVLNTLFLAMDRYPIDKTSEQVNETANFVFYLIFVVEMLLKLYGMGFKLYWADSFRIFDAIVVILSTVEIILANSGTAGSGGNTISAFRAVRLLRIFKLAKQWQSLRNLLVTIKKTMYDVSYFSILLLLFIFIYTLIGMELFAYELQFDEEGNYKQDGQSPRENFDDFLHAFLSVYAVLVGDDWQNLMYAAIRIKGYFASLYFVSLILFGNVLLLNLFLAILLGNFETSEIDAAKLEKGRKRRQQIQNAPHALESDEKNDDRGDRRGSVGSLSFLQLPMIKLPTHMQKTLTGRSLCLLSPGNRFRQLVSKVVKTRHFENGVLILIIFSSLILAMDNPLNDPKGQFSITLSWMDVVVTILFALECLMKVIVHGLWNCGPNSYLRSGWNVLDFVIVCTSLTSLIIGGDNDLSNLKALRTFRVLKPLRIISRTENLKLVINSLIRSIPSIGNVLIIWLFFWGLLGIIWVNYLKGQLFHWNLDNIPNLMVNAEIKNKQDCLDVGGSWINKDANFDNTLNAILALFIASTTEGWLGIMYSGVDAVGIHKQPEFEANIGWIFFFIFYIIVASFFLLNLLVGVIIDNYNIEKNIERGEAFLNSSQREYVLVKAYMLNYKPIKIKTPPKNLFRCFCFRVAESTAFDLFILACIILNTVALALQWYGEPQTLTIIVDAVNLTFTIVFTIEAFLKVVAYKKSYFYDAANVFDFGIVVLSWIELILSFFTSTVLEIITLFRIFRIGRALRLVKSAKSLRVIFSTFILSIPQVMNIGALLLLFIYIYAILGMQMFAKVKVHGELNEYANFQEFWKAFMILIRCSTGEAWDLLMFAVARQPSAIFDWIFDPSFDEIQDNEGRPNGWGTSFAYVYFISYLLVVAFVFVNLFIAVILQGFAESESIENGKLTGQHYLNFRTEWAKFDPEASEFINVTDLPQLLAGLDPPIGTRGMNEREKRDFLKFLTNIELSVFNNQYHFFEIATSLAMLVYNEVKDSVSNFESDEPVFRQIQKKSHAKFPMLKVPQIYTSKHVFATLFIQKRFRQLLERIRARREIELDEPQTGRFASPDSSYEESEYTCRSVSRQDISEESENEEESQLQIDG